jgi:hypothetical protein
MSAEIHPFPVPDHVLIYDARDPETNRKFYCVALFMDGGELIMSDRDSYFWASVDAAEYGLPVVDWTKDGTA